MKFLSGENSSRQVSLSDISTDRQLKGQSACTCQDWRHHKSLCQVLLLGSVANASIPVSQGGGGNCSLEFAADSLVVQAPGLWSMLVYLGSQQIRESPFAIDVLPAPVAPLASYAVNQRGQQLQPCSDPTTCPVLLQVPI